MGTILNVLLLIVFGIILYLNLLSSLNVQDASESNSIANDLHEEINSINDVFNRTLGCEKIFASNLPERSDRRDSLSLAAAVSNISLEFIEAVRGETIADNILPISARPVLRYKENGAVASHIETLTEIVSRNLSTVLIFEDDIDWDIRLKSQLHEFAISSRSLASKNLSKGDLNFDTTSNVSSQSISPYGDDWDILWLGHWGMQLSNSPRIIHYADATIPGLRHLSGWNPNGTPLKIYPHHTRIVTQGLGDVCLFAYAVFQKGARKLLHSTGIESYDLMDNAVTHFCDGTNGFEKHQCRSVIPQLFDTWRPAGSSWRDSDINRVSKKDAVVREGGRGYDPKY